LLTPDENDLPIDLTVPVDGNMAGRCAKTATFTNSLTNPGVKAQVQKITDPVLASNDPQYTWDFTLNGPGLALDACTASAGAGAGFVLFKDSLNNDCLLSNGPYTATETLKLGWKEDYAVPNDGVNTLVCTFTVDLFADEGTIKSCTFHNTKLAHATLFKTKSGLPDLSSTDSFTFQLRQGADATHTGTILETEVANLADLFQHAFTFDLVPGDHYQFCEVVMPGWLSNIGTIVPNAFMPPDGVPANPNVDNSILCVDFVPAPGEAREFRIDNTPPPGGRALTIGFWKNWSSCTGGRQADTLGATLALAPAGVQVGSFRLTGPCSYVVNLLNKSTMTTGKKMASDPIFNMVAQLIAAELNVKAGAGICPKAALAITQANALLSKYFFDGDSYHPKLTKADATIANNLATELDNYNNDRPSACL